MLAHIGDPVADALEKVPDFSGTQLHALTNLRDTLDGRLRTLLQLDARPRGRARQPCPRLLERIVESLPALLASAAVVCQAWASW